ncbi:hypothetical protein MKZ38_008767 [Zalerion maritima]|uniref:Uncharacterized protein n=1 Tax=Zalerion maritima TaxID=339359 RepID=A0AAD5RVH9_9PEZI|nr:hypothetical protein MKZ38_008767 [Zalerion maritima]
MTAFFCASLDLAHIIISRQSSTECPSGKSFYNCNQGELRGCCSHDPCTDNVCEDDDFVNSPLTTLTSKTKTTNTSKDTATPTATAITRSEGETESTGAASSVFNPDSTVSAVPTSTSTSNTSSDGISDGISSSSADPILSKGAIIGIAVGGFVFLCCILLSLFFIIKKCRRGRATPDPTGLPQSPSPSRLAEKYFPDRSTTETGTTGHNTPFVESQDEGHSAAVVQFVENDRTGSPPELVRKNNLFVTNPDNTPISPAAVPVRPTVREGVVGPESAQFGHGGQGHEGQHGQSYHAEEHHDAHGQAQEHRNTADHHHHHQGPHHDQPYVPISAPVRHGPMLGVQEADGTPRPAEMDGRAVITNRAEPTHTNPSNLQHQPHWSTQGPEMQQIKQSVSGPRVQGNLVITDEERQAGYGHVSSWASYHG